MRFPLALRRTVDALQSEVDQLVEAKDIAVRQLLLISHRAVAERMRHKYAAFTDENGDVPLECRGCAVFKAYQKKAKELYEVD